MHTQTCTHTQVYIYTASIVTQAVIHRRKKKKKCQILVGSKNSEERICQRRHELIYNDVANRCHLNAVFPNLIPRHGLPTALLSEQYPFQLRFGYCHNICLKYLYSPILLLFPLSLLLFFSSPLIIPGPRGLLTDVHSSHGVRDGKLPFGSREAQSWARTVDSTRPPARSLHFSWGIDFCFE